MFSIGEFARHGRVSVRMLMHYDAIGPVGQALARWIDANGYRSVGYAREVTLEWSADRDQWVTELQQPIDATGG
jgi:DNA-binding transcriptional MerR regulator